MAKAFQCDRCKELFPGNGLTATAGYKNYELCDNCFKEFKSFVGGATLGLSDDTVRELFNTLNEAWAFDEVGEKALHVQTCSNCYHKTVCGNYSPYSDASMCKQFVSACGIMMGAEKRLRLTNAVEKCLKVLDENTKGE